MVSGYINKLCATINDELMRYFFLLLILFSNNLIGQTFSVQSSTSLPNIALKGSIDKYKISMMINVNGEHLFGNYKYKNSENVIPINGFMKDGVVWLNEYIIKEGKYFLNASFMGKMEHDSIYGSWTDFKNKKFDFVLYTKDNLINYYSSSGIVLTIEDRGIRELFVDMGLNSIYKTNIIYSTKKENNYYVLVKCEAYSNGGCYPRGTCGCGVESKIALIQLTNDYEIEKVQFLLLISCIESIETHNELGQEVSDEFLTNDLSLKMYNAQNNENSRITFCLKMPELGIKKEKINK